MTYITLRPTQIKRKNNYRLMEYWHNETTPFYMAITPDYEHIEMQAINRKQAIKEFTRDIVGD